MFFLRCSHLCQVTSINEIQIKAIVLYVMYPGGGGGGLIASSKVLKKYVMKKKVAKYCYFDFAGFASGTASGTANEPWSAAQHFPNVSIPKVHSLFKANFIFFF